MSQERKYLFECYTKATGTIYVVATDPTKARDAIQSRLRESDYGHIKDRVVTRIDIKALEQGMRFNEAKGYSFTENQPLVIII